MSFGFAIGLLGGCSQIPVWLGRATPQASPSASMQPTGLPTRDSTPGTEKPATGEALTPAPTSSAVITPTLTIIPTPTASITILRLWLPPMFNPDSGTPAGDILKERLDAFVQENPNVRLDVRIKAMEGPGGLQDMLSTASAAAPVALPDLIALPRLYLESAALKGLLHPFDDLTTIMDNPDWYNYARQLSRLENSTFGLPFAGDGMIMVYRGKGLQDLPQDWAATLEITGTLAFPAADPESLFTLALYQSSGGPVRDDQGRAVLSAEILAQPLAFYQNAVQLGVMSFGLAQYEQDQQVWDAFRDNQHYVIATWLSQYLQQQYEPGFDTTPEMIPTGNGSSFTLADGWLWAIASAHPDQQEITARLAAYLVDGRFLARWTYALGYMPPRAEALTGWPDSSLKSLVGRVALAAQLIPSTDVVSSLGPAIRNAVLQVLGGQMEPSEAAQEAANQLTVP